MFAVYQIENEVSHIEKKKSALLEDKKRKKSEATDIYINKHLGKIILLPPPFLFCWPPPICSLLSLKVAVWEHCQYIVVSWGSFPLTERALAPASPIKAM